MRYREQIGTGYLEWIPGYGLESRGIGVCFRVGARVFSSPQCPERLWGLLNLQWLYEKLPRRVKRPEHEDDHSSPFNDEVTNVYFPPYVL
jgi:hypothetical protein